MKSSQTLAIMLALIALSLPACQRHTDQPESEHQKIVVTSPMAKDVVITQPYVCQIHSRNHIEVRALQEGYLEEIPLKEGQAVKQGDVMFRVVPVLFKARLEAERAEARVAQIEYENTKKLAEGYRPVVSQTEVALYAAKLARAEAKVKLAEAEWEFTVVKAPFDGIIDRLRQQKGSLVKKEEVLTTLSDNSVMWVYFNVPEARYFEYMANRDKDKESRHVELVLANGSKFPYSATSIVIEGQFNNETGNIPFRADFPNQDGLLRHGQTGNVLIHRTLKNAILIPQRATFEILDKVYVYVVGEDEVAHPRPIVVSKYELDDIFIVEKGLDVNDKFVLEGVRQVHDGKKVEYEFRKPEEALANQKNPAE